MDWTSKDPSAIKPARRKRTKQVVPPSNHTAFSLESLEPRLLLSASPLVAPLGDEHALPDVPVAAPIAIVQDVVPPAADIPVAVAAAAADAPAGTASVSGIAYAWNSHVQLSGVAVTLTGADGSAGSGTTDGSGNFAAGGLGAGSYSVAASLPATQLGRTITSSSALAALRVAVGVDPNATTSGVQLPLSPYQFIAADVNADSRVTSSDALAILRIAVHAPNAIAPKWVFVNEDTTFFDPASQSVTVTKSAVPTSFASSQTVGAGATVNLVGVLTGDVLGKYVPYDANGVAVANPPTLPAAGFLALSASKAAPAYIYGVSGAGTLSLTAALANDTGASAADSISSDATVSGQATGIGPIVSFKGGLDATTAAGFASLADAIGTTGAFTLTPARLAALAGGTLADGSHTLHLSAADVNGNVATLDFAFTVLTAAPTIMSLGLSPASGAAADNTTSAATVALTGMSTAAATITVAGQSGLAGASGTFQIGGVTLQDGANTFVATALDKAGNTATRTVTITKQGTLAADQTLIWNQAALNAIQKQVLYPEDATRVLAMMSLAQYDTLAAIQGSPAYLVSRSVTGPVSIDLALAEAAAVVLDNLLPAQKAGFDGMVAALAATIPDGAAKTAALALGADIGQTVYNIRADDGSGTYVDYTGSTVVGKWRPTGPMYLVAENAQWGSVTPFALTSGSEFRPAAPPDTTSAEYAAALNEVQSLGSATSTTRTADETQMALFWADGRGSYTPPGHWVQIAEGVALSKGNSLADNVRLFAQLNVAMADSAIAAWDAKYTYGTWRPQDAIHNADQDGNAATTADPAWTSLIIAPAHPDYVSGHSTFSYAAAVVLANAFGDSTAFSTTASTLPGVTRSFTSFTQAAYEAGRSRIYAGIHTETADAAGIALGKQVASTVLTRFSLSLDTQPPTIVVPVTPAVTNANLVLAGSIVDNISGVASASYAIDGGKATALVLDATGKFSLTTAFATDGTADGAHSIVITTKDVAGNAAAPFTRSFTLDTKLPVLSLTSLADADVLTGSSRLTGTANPTGSALVSLTLAIDGGKAAPLVFDAATGAFDQALPIANLAIGTHSLVLTAVDAAGNVATLTRSVSVQALAAFTITAETPADGTIDIGVTQRPQVFFSRAVNAATLTASSYYATGPDGSVLPTTIVPASDGSFAWLFFTNPMPGGATVTIHVVGSSIRAAADGVFLDGDGDGVGGGTSTFSFTTVSLTTVTGTKLVGRVVDPGPDLVPMTFDDIGRGPDGVLNTADDVFKLPIANAKVYILGRENIVVYTDANGLFELDDIPADTVKVAIDGRTATNAPAGYFFPEMVQSATIKAGVTNTLMDSVGTDASQAANAGLKEVYLPRVPTNALQAVSDTATTVITASQASAPELSATQLSSLSLTVPAGSAVGADGKTLTGVTIGIATVPPELVKDMLPEGVLQHTFDITIQAPGVSTFTTPVQITFPNVFNAAPGTKLNVLSFDHTTGKLVINGTATVSADGKTVVSDPDGGIKAPGWHGLTPPGGPSDPPCVPGTPATVKVPPVPVSSGLVDHLFVKDGDTFTISFGNAAAKIDPSTDPCSPTNIVATPLIVSVMVEGNPDSFLSGDLTTTQYTLYPGQVQNINVSLKTLLDHIKDINADILYGAKITVNAWASDDPGTLLINNQKAYIYRYVDAADSNHTDGVVEMEDTTNDGAGGVWRTRDLTDMTGAAMPTFNVADTTNFSGILLPAQFLFDPTVTGNDLTTQVQIKDPDGNVAGSLTLKGDGVKQTYFVDKTAFLSELLALSTNPALTATEQGLLDTAAKRQAIMDGALARVATLDAGYAAGVDVASSAAGATTVFNTFDTAAGVMTYGQSAVIDNTGNGGLETAGGLLAKRTDYSIPEQDFRLSETLNENTGKTVAMHLRNFFDGVNSITATAVINGIAKSMAHEMGHSVGLNHTAGNGKSTGLPGATTDIMAQGSDYAGTRSWSESASDAYDVAVGITYTPAQAQVALNYYAAYIAAGGDFDAPDNAKDPNVPVRPGLTGAVAWIMTDPGNAFVNGSVDFGNVAVDGAGGASVVKQYKIVNLGNDPLVIDSVGLGASVSGLTLSSIAKGTTIASGKSLDFTVTFDPTASGKVTGQFLMRSNAAAGDYTFSISAQGVSPNADLDIAVPDDNVGGQQVGSAKASNSFGTITNAGSADLVISNVVTTDPSFAVTGLMANLSAGSPLVIHPQGSVTFGISFKPGAVGLQHGLIQIASNDPAHPMTQWGVVGTGLAAGKSALDYGNDYVELDQINNTGAPVLRATSDAMGAWSFFLPSSQSVHYSIFDPTSGLIASAYDTTAASGNTTKFTQAYFRASTANDSDFDGLPDDIEMAIGSGITLKDTNKDGIDDFTALKLGLNPAGNASLPVGIVATATLTGPAIAVVVAASPADASKLTAYVATGTTGLAIIDVSQINKPKILGELPLLGDATGLAVDAVRGLVAVADGATGLQIVDVSTPTAPKVTQTVALPNPATRVVLQDGVAYVANGTAISTVDIVTGEVLQTLDVKGSTLTDLSFSGTTLFTLDSSDVLRAISVSGDLLAARGSITVSGAGGKITAAGSVVYVGASNGFTGGFETVDASNLDSLTLLSGVDSTGIGGGAMALNGSGLGIAVGTPGRVNALDVISVADPTDTSKFLTRVALPSVPNDVALANGIAFVADGTSGLQVVNYLGFDTKGVPPAISIALDAVDADATKPGIQVVEGSTLHITPTVTDDVQVRNVELLVNGAVVANDPAYPFDFSIAIPTIASGGKSVTIQARATDTGGNVTLSAPTTLDVVPDTFPPAVSSVSVADGARLFFVRSVQVTFSEPIDTTKLALSGISLVGKGPDGVLGTADDVKVTVSTNTRGGGRVLSIIPSAYLAPGDYTLTISPSVIADRVGNALAAPITVNFTIRPASDIRATTGTSAVPTAPSANPGQTIALPVPFDPTTAYATFSVINSNGGTSTRDVAVTRSDKVKGVAYFVVPDVANTGDVVVYSLVGSTKTSFADGTFYLQILPTVTGITVQSVASDGSSAVLVLTGTGFIEGSASYAFGSTTVTDTSISGGPDVYMTGYLSNGTVAVTVPLSDGVFGPVVVSTSGGSSAAYVASVASVTSVALSGTPADASVASANPGQAVTLNGAGLSVGTAVLFHYVDNDGTARVVSLAPTSAAADGSSAVVVLPTYANGVGKLQVFGSSTQPVLQIVPVLSGFSVSGGTLTLLGGGLVEGASTYRVGSAAVVDTSAATGPDVVASYLNGYVGNGSASFADPVHGAGASGTASITTAGGTSAALALNTLDPGVGYLRDLAVDAASGAVWVIDNAQPAVLHKIDATTGAALSSITLTDAGFGSSVSYYGEGLQVVAQAFTLAGTSVPAGSLLLFHASPNPDRVIAVNPTTGNVIASLSLAANYDTTGGAYDAVTGHLFLLDRRTSPSRVVEVNPATGAELSGFNLPFNAGEAGLTVNPTTGNLWYGSDQSGTVLELSKTGTLLRTLDLTLQNVPANTTTGLSFDASGTLLVATSTGNIFRVNTAADPAAQTLATLTGLSALAVDGTPAAAAVASANVGQVITLTGTNFGAGTEVVFNTRDNAGNTTVVAQSPVVVNAAGTVLQVVVPNLAATGNVSVVNTGSRNLGFSSYNDAVYRQVTLSYTPAAASSVIRFNDLGLEGLDNESWGLDNVRVAQAGATVFSDNFEGGAKSNWSNAATDASNPGVFSQFSGRFNNQAQTLNLSGLAVGQAVTLTFDLYVLDSWDGNSTANGPDTFQVSADGATLMQDTFENYNLGAVQSYGASAGIKLQIVPTLSATGRPGSDNAFTLTGSGFQEGASTVVVGGVALIDRFASGGQLDVTGTRNDTLSLTAPLVLDGPVRITTDGGSATLAGPVFGVQPPTLFSAIQANAVAGVAADATKPSANVGQTITLVGQGFTGSTLVQFAGVDDTGTAGTLTRSGTAGANGTTLTIVVPELARTGAVTVLGSGASVTLQVVPLLRGVGGTIVAGGQVLLDGTGLVNTELSVSVDGRAAGTFAVRSVADVGAGATLSQQGQQLLSVTVPAGIGAGVITVTTAGGSFVLRTGVTVAVASTAPATDVGDTLATAQAIGLAQGARLSIAGKTSDGASGAGLDVDLYKLTLVAGDQLTLNLTGSSYSTMRVFDASGTQISSQQFAPTGSSAIVLTAPSSGAFYVGVSGYSNTSYNPATAGSGTASTSYTGTYQLVAERIGGGDSRLSGITGTATYGTAARAGIASANVGQTVTIAGAGLVTGEKLLFSAIDVSGTRYWSQVTAASVAPDGTSLTAVVPVDATTGTVRLVRDPAGILLQVVPHLTHIDAPAGQTYDGGSLSLAGSGFAEGATTVLFGTAALADSGRNDGLDVSYTYPSYQQNSAINLTVPGGVPSGPITVVTTGGTSDVAGPAFTGITAVASSGTAAASAVPSAVPGQAITITGTGFDTATDVVFETIDGGGARSQVLVRPTTVNATGTSASVVVPINAVSGRVRVVGDQNATQAALQIVPTVTGLTLQSVASDGSSAVLVLSGSGFVEGAAQYKVGSTVVPDTNAGQGPDVYADYRNGYVANSAVTLTVPLTDGAFGPVTVTTAGGASAAYTASLASITGVALSGTPADASVASANPGQAVTLNGAGLSVGTAVLFHYVDSDGTVRVVSLAPTSAAADGSSAVVVLPTYANGVGKLQVFGSSTQPVLQIVPVLSGFSVSGGTLTLLGGGLVEGASTYRVGSAAVVDTSAATGPDVVASYLNGYVGNGSASFADPVHGAGASGTASITTAGGTSAALALNTLDPGVGYLRDLAVDTASGAVWVIDNAQPAVLHKIDATTGAALSSITLTDAGFGSSVSYYGEGLQVVAQAFTLAGTSVPAGSLLLFHASPNPDRVIAVNPTTGNVIASLSLAANYDTTGGAYDAVTGHLFLLDRRTSPSRVVEVNPATGAELSGFNLPFNAGEAGLTVNPTTGNLWYGSDQSGTVLELSKTGTLLRTLDLTLQNVPANTTTGLSFDASGTLLVATSTGNIFRVNTAADPAAQTLATLTGLSALAVDGTPAAAAVASANVGQVITLTGTNFGAGTEVVFNTRDNAGNTTVVAQSPVVVNAAGTVLQVVVPNLAATGNVSVVNTGSRNLGFSSYNDAVYRQVTLSYTPAAASSVIRFNDLGLEGLDNESWGLDNVRVAQAGATVFSDNFEGGAKSNWSNAATDASNPGVFSQFSGRFNNQAQTLNLSGLAVGQAVTLTFDLYVLDSWDGNSTANGPDTFQVSADGATLMQDTFENYNLGAVQSYGASAGIKLQIVPTLSATGRPGSDNAFTLTGSGFQEGASTVVVGGVALIDRFASGGQLDVTGTRNDTLSLTAPLVLDGPVRITTDGGSATLAGPVFGVQPPTLFSAIQANAVAGVAADATKPSANVGQTITLVGQGFTGSTLVQFAGVDDTGTAGTLTRSGTAGANGTTLTIVVPELARTGAVTVLGSGASVTLQVVPLLRGVGGTIVAGGQVLLDGTGLVNTELSVSVDGRAAGTFAVRSVADVGAGATLSQQGQQLLSVTVPAGIGAGVITVTTAGGSFVLRTGVTVAVASTAPATDVGDTLATAQAIGLAQGARLSIAGKTSDGASGAGLDVDLYKLTLVAGDQLTLNLTGSSYSTMRVFDASGTQISSQQFAPTGSSAIVLTAPSSGAFYVGVSGYSNTSYNPATAGSGTASTSYTGTYQLVAERIGGGDSRLSGITGTATYGTAARAGIASANVGQTVTIAGAGLVTGEKLLFSAIDVSGTRYWSQVTAASVAPDGTSLTAVVPVDATTGTVRLVRDPAGILLQVVPHLTHIDAPAGQTYDGGSLSLAGSGFAEGATTVLFGTAALADSGRNDGLDVSYTYPSYQQNSAINLTVPGGVPSGPITVVTTGGTSDVAGPAFTGITAVASSGTAAASAVPSAVPGQAITITGTGFDTATDVVFETIDGGGARSQVLVRPTTVNATGTSASVVVPINAVSGRVRVVGDQNATQAALQIVPTVTGLTLQSVASDGSSAVLVLSGSGFVEGAAQYKVGSTVVPDTNAGQGPDVYADYRNGYVANSAVTLTVPLTDGAFGPVTVTTAGGASAAYTASLASITGVALSGTPADASVASANPGQAVTLNGAGLSVGTAVLFHYVDSDGTVRVVSLAPTSAAADGSSAVVVLPTYANGVGKLQVFGSSTQPVLQIVPVLSGFSVSGGTLTLLGGGLVEGASTYRVGSAAVVDTSAATGPDVVASYLNGYVGNGSASFADPVHGAGASGTASITTAGGTSAALALNTLDPGVGYLRDLAVDTASGAVWVIDNAQPAVLHKIDATTGAALSSITLTDAGFGSSVSYYGEGLQVVAQAFTLAGTSVPAGSLLLFHASPNPDRVIAVNPTTGNVIASLSLAANYDTTGGAYDAVTGHLFLLDRRTSPSRVVEVNPATGAELSGFNLPFNAGEAGLTVNPTTGNLWYGSDQSGTVLELSKTGTLLRTLDLTLQNVPANTTTGLSFDASGTLLVATSTGNIFRVAV